MFLRGSDRLHYFYQWVGSAAIIIQTDLYLSMSCSFICTLWYFDIVRFDFLQNHKALPSSSVSKKLASPPVLVHRPQYLLQIRITTSRHAELWLLANSFNTYFAALRWSTHPGFPGPFLVSALKGLHARNSLSLRQTRTIGDPVIYHILIELEQTLKIRMIPTISF